jgi:mannose-6-phosphate isomerase-like protein (cupin superfamily)
MEEYFYFLSGEGKYFVGDEVFNLKKGSFVVIPANTKHSLENTGNETLEFFYWGIATK